jgi:hypothetical protein
MEDDIGPRLIDAVEKLRRAHEEGDEDAIKLYQQLVWDLSGERVRQGLPEVETR